MNEQGDSAVLLLRAQGKRLTPQRLLVLEAIRASPGHITADEVFDAVTARYPYINRATIYRTLSWLKEQGLVCVTDLGSGAVEYEYLGERRHHHLICLRCGGQQEFSAELTAPLAEELQRRHDFAARLDHLAIFGLCRACQEEPAAAHALAEHA